MQTVDEKVVEEIDKNVKIQSVYLPEHMQEGAIAYVMTGRRPGDFLSAIFANNFVEAAGRADEQNQVALFMWAKFLYNVPSGCWGSMEMVNNWMAIGGIRGIYKKKEEKNAVDEPSTD